MAEIIEKGDDYPVVVRKEKQEVAKVEAVDEIILTTKAFVPSKFVDIDRVEDRFSAPMFVNEKNCNSCYWRPTRVDKACLTCANFSGYMDLFKQTVVKGVEYTGIPLANWSKSMDMLDVPDIPVRDLRPDIPMKHLKFTGKLYDATDAANDSTKTDQQTIVKDWLKNAEKRDYCGIVVSSPRSGKTLLGLNIAIEHLQKKTFITGAQIEWLVNFCEDMSFMTNIKELAKKKIHPVYFVSSKPEIKRTLEPWGVKVVSSWAKVPDDCDIVLSTYLVLKRKPGESVYKPPEVMRKYVIGKFTTVIVDETHQGAAPVLGMVLNNIDVTHRIGLTATADRKDGMSFILYKIMGPAAAISDAPAMVPNFELFETGISKRPEDINTDNPTAYETWLSYHKDRNKIIIRKIFEDLAADPKHNILLPVRRVNHALDMARKINETAAFKNQKEGTNYPIPLAIVFADKQGDRQLAIKKARAGTVRVTVAIEKIVKHALSVPAWTHIYTGITPISNGPMFYQLFSRVSTPPKPGDKKPQPVVRHIVDATAASVKTLKNLYYSEFDSLRDALKGSDTRQKKLHMDQKELIRMGGILANPYVYFGPGKEDKLNRTRQRKGKMGFSKMRSYDTR